MKVKCKQSNKFLIKDEWYKVINKSIIRHSKTSVIFENLTSIDF